MSYETFDNKHRRQKFYVILWSAAVITSLVAIIIINSGRQSYAIYKTAPFLDHKFLERDICAAGFDAIVNRGAVSSLVVDWYLAALQESKYSMIDFKVTKGDYRLIKMEQDSCKIILKDRQTKGHGLRSFQIKLEQSSEYIFNYKISSIAEVLLEDVDLNWR